MSISSALNSALTGLTANSRAAEIIAENIANAQTLGYARRSLTLSSNSVSPGVRVLGVQRHADPGIIANRRAADAVYSAAETLAGFSARFEALIGSGNDAASLTTRIAEFETSLIEAASRPESPQRLDTAVARAKDLAQKISDASEGVRKMRSQADSAIAVQVDRLNQALQDVQTLNTRITRTTISGGETASLFDQRQILIDEINQIVPVTVIARDHGQVSLFSEGGAILLDGPTATVSFTSVRDTMPEMTLENGALSGLEVNGIAIRTDSEKGPLRGGSLGAQFEIRDELAVSAQSDLDAVARDLIERFETPTLDASVAPGDPGLFTDGGGVFDAAAQVGLAGRLTVNALVDAAQGGESWRLRTGLGAAGPGDLGEARQIQAFADILTERRAPGSPVFGTGQVTFSGLGTGLTSRVAQSGAESDRSLSFAAASLTELTRVELAQGVDTDAELQALMVIEQAYAANARMIEVADEMMQAILRM